MALTPPRGWIREEPGPERRNFRLLFLDIKLGWYIITRENACGELFRNVQNSLFNVCLIKLIVNS